MIDDFRQQADAGSFLDDDDELDGETTKTPKEMQVSGQRILGMTPVQRFVIAFLLLILTCLFSALCLLASGKVVPLSL
jgi:ABC-type Na+ efflux pump permease subunit